MAQVGESNVALMNMEFKENVIHVESMDIKQNKYPNKNKPEEGKGKRKFLAHAITAVRLGTSLQTVEI